MSSINRRRGSKTPAALGPEIAAAWDDAERVHGLRVDEHSFISVFEALRRPA
jgi:DEAD/DEAH box helicase domain-containing protein